MFKSRNILFLMLISVMMLVLAACGGDDEVTTNESENNATTDTGTESNSAADAELDFEGVKFISILTGGTQGTYYPLGGTFADLITSATDVKTTAEVSQASAANMTALAAGNGEVAFVQTDIAYYATQGTLMFDGNAMDSVVALGALYPETVQLVTLADSGIKTFADLKGKKVSVGAPGSGTYANAEQLLEIHGLSIKDDIEAQNLDFGESTDGIQSGQIDAAFITAGYPTGAVEALNATKGVYIVPVEADKAAELIAKYPYYAVDKIPTGTYGLEADVPAVSVGAMLAVKRDLPDDLVYAMTKAIYDNTDKISHAKGAFIKAATGLDGIGIDVHPGAQRYFDEVK